MEGALPALFVVVLAATVVAVFSAQKLAQSKNRAVTAWMWTAALFPPSTLILAALSGRDEPLAGADA